jgi:ubiquinone/menaquinone biosynthesis C-methylase UbiE
VGDRQQSRYYDAYWSPGGFQPHEPLPPFLEGVYGAELKPGSRCLDVGCGSGTKSGPWITHRGHEYVGVDVSPVAVQQARSRGLDARVITDATDLPFAGHEFDVVVCIEVLEHLFRPDEAIDEFSRVLRADGVVIATVPNMAFWRRRTDAIIGRWNPGGDTASVAKPWRDPHIRFFNRTVLERMFREAGFPEVHVTGFGGGFFSQLPWLRERVHVHSLSSFYERAQGRSPSLLASRLCVVARNGPVSPTRRRDAFSRRRLVGEDDPDRT